MPDGSVGQPISRRLMLRLAASTSVVAAVATGDDDVGAHRKRIYIAADDHTDYMWTADEQTYRQAFLETIDHYLDLADQTDDRPLHFQSRWNCDGLLWLREYEQHKSPEQVDRLVRRIKSGHISFPMTVLVSCYGAMPAEAAIRSLYYGGQVERRYQIRLPMAVAMENQTLPLGLGMLWAGSGVRYSWRGICGCASKIKDSASRRDHDVYWWVGPDGSRVLMKWYSLYKPVTNGSYWNEGPGGYAEARYPEAAIKFVETDADFQSRNPHHVLGLFGQGWDDLETKVELDDPVNSFPAVAQRMTDETRQVIVSNELDYFHDMEQTHGKGLPAVQCSFGNEWELYSASLAEVSASVKRATEKLRAAEAMAVMVEQERPGFDRSLDGMRDQAWIAMGLYWEHDWTADGPVSRKQRAAWQRKIARQIVDYVDSLHDLAAKALGELIGSDDPSDLKNNRRIFVFNPLSWERTDVVDVAIDGDDWHVVDKANEKTLVSQVAVQEGHTSLRFLAEKIPACGYRVFELRAGKTQPAAATIRVTDGKMVSAHDTIIVSPDGAIDFWGATRLGKVMIKPGARGNHLEPALGKISIESSGPISTTVRVDVARPIARTTRVTLFEHLDRIEIDNRLRENFSSVESWRYVFNLRFPRTVHEEVGAVIRASTLAEGGDYADRNARTDWLTMNRMVLMRDTTAAVTIANRDCLFFHLGDARTDPMDSSSNTIYALAGGQVDGSKLGIPDQGGDKTFVQRFALTASSPKRTIAAAMRGSMEFANPLVVGQIESFDGPLHPTELSILNVSSDSIIASAMKVADTRDGFVVRLWNLADKPARCTVSMNRPITSCKQVTHVETDIGPMEVADGKVAVAIPARGWLTLQVNV
ncbi:hypothetical protein Poly51_21600 [Rubripirellula tenax]|uniref:Glycosyl hydrolases family 38 C-terminal domain-containing protein n=1 Tax=Rubripirellula tenax TaxID=2528015 RepID=A0A5C6FF52_9BACT|nr:glycosyl hydrolase-related protein [Rubripirellula tenax]TWU59372.1 hypothetical protein Poly51_21600 [Rubripirellula tenax]